MFLSEMIFCLGTRSRLASHVVCLNTFTPHFPNEKVLQSKQSSLISVRRVPSPQKKSSSEEVDRHVDFPDNIYLISNTFALQFPCKEFLPHKKRSSEGVDHQVDFHSFFISQTKTFSRVNNLFWFPCEEFLPLKKNVALKGLIATLTFRTIYIWIYSLFKFQTKRSFLSKKKKAKKKKTLLWSGWSPRWLSR